MALSACASVTDTTGRELVEHGATAFPIACYHDDLEKNEVPWHWHEELELVIVTSGSCTLAAGQEKRVLGAGEGIFVNTSVLHGAWAAGPEASCHSIVFHPRLVGGSLDSVFYQQYLQPLLDRGNLEYLFLQPEIPWHRMLLNALEQVWQACVEEAPGYEFAVRQGLSAMTFQLYSHLSPQQPGPSSKALRDAQRIKTMLSFLHTRFAQALTVERIAASAAISPSECLRCFRATIGTTPMQYLHRYRLQQAAQRLRSTRTSIGDIAFGCGFQDLSYFTRSFRREKGCTPSEYRRKTL